jgi:hypothetical protein
MRQETTQHSQTLIEVSADPDWEAIAAAVAGALGSPPRLTAGEELSRQRRIENAATCRQIRLWLADIGVTVQQPYPFACECGRSTCALTVSATPDEYDVRRAAAPFAAEGHPETQRS